MATRFYLPASGSAPVDPSISSWSHTNVARRPTSPRKAVTAMATTSYSPDGADHLADGDSHFVQFVSAPLPAQTIAAQTVKLQVRCSEVHANNNLFLTWRISAVSRDGATERGVLLAKRRMSTNEVATSLTNRGDSATTSAITLQEGDRLVFELGLGGTPANTSGVQGHNGGMSFGDDNASDLPEDQSTTTALNPWLEFAADLKWRRDVVIFTPLQNAPPASNYATLDTRNGHPVLDFDAATKEGAYFTATLPRSYTSAGLTVTLVWMASTATSGVTRWLVAFERLAAAGHDLDADDFAAAKAGEGTADATSGKLTYTAITFASGEIDGVQPGEAFRLRVERDAAHANDTMAGDAELVAVEVREL